MKLPTLNVDVAVNTAGMKKDIAKANKELQTIGGKGLAFAGGSFGKIGSLGSLGGGMGSAAIAAGGIGLAVAGPLMVMNRVVDAFSSSMKNGKDAVDAFAKEGKFQGMNIAMAIPLAMAAQRQPQALQAGAGGFMDAFSYGAVNQYGQAGGLIGWFQDAMLSLKGAAAYMGAVFGGLDEAEATRKFMVASSESQGAAMTFMTDTERKELKRAMDEAARQKREQET